VPVHRQEVYDEIQRNNQQALVRPAAPLPKLVTAQNKTTASAPILKGTKI
jgi:sRNA-binding carbon storage regulator CsrA